MKTAFIHPIHPQILFKAAKPCIRRIPNIRLRYYPRGFRGKARDAQARLHFSSLAIGNNISARFLNAHTENLVAFLLAQSTGKHFFRLPLDDVAVVALVQASPCCGNDAALFLICVSPV